MKWWGKIQAKTTGKSPEVRRGYFLQRRKPEFHPVPLSKAPDVHDKSALLNSLHVALTRTAKVKDTSEKTDNSD